MNTTKHFRKKCKVNKTTFYCIAPVLKNWTEQPNNFGQTFFRFGLIFTPLKKKVPAKLNLRLYGILKNSSALRFSLYIRFASTLKNTRVFLKQRNVVLSPLGIQCLRKQHI